MNRVGNMLYTCRVNNYKSEISLKSRFKFCVSMNNKYFQLI